MLKLKTYTTILLLHIGYYSFAQHTYTIRNTDFDCYNYTEMNGVLYFASYHWLYKTDGTSFGTRQVKKIKDDYNYDDIICSHLTVVNNELFFVDKDGDNGEELWKSDGTESGTTIVKDIISGYSSSEPNYLINYKDTLFFSARGPLKGRELWKSDGTDSGTILIKDINTDGWNGSNPKHLVVSNGVLYFSAYEKTHGTELWRSDGTENGTYLVKDLVPGTDGSNPEYIVDINGTLLVFAQGKVFLSDGTEGGTKEIKSIRSDKKYTKIYNLRVVKNQVYFIADDGIHGKELWKSDGTAEGTHMVKDIRENSTEDSWIENLSNMDSILFFSASNGFEELELWRSDGTEKGTYMLKDINLNGSSRPRALTLYKNHIYFSAYLYDIELWRTDGTEEGTIRVHVLNTSSSISSEIREMGVFNDKLFLSFKDNSNDIRLYAHDFDKFDPFIGINEIVKEKDIYPNPSSGLYTIKQYNPTTHDISVIDCFGNKLLISAINENNVLDLNHLSNGLYLVKITEKRNGKEVIHKIIKK